MRQGSRAALSQEESTERSLLMTLHKVDFTNRHGIIAVAGQGIGRTLALEFGRRDGHLLLIGWQAATLTETARLVVSKGELPRSWSRT